MNGYQEVEQVMQQMRLIDSHERPEALVGKAISVFLKEEKVFRCGSVLSFEVRFQPREESPPGERPLLRDAEVLVQMSLPEPITVSRTRYAGEKTMVVWRYGNKAVNFDEDVTVR